MAMASLMVSIAIALPAQANCPGSVGNVEWHPLGMAAWHPPPTIVVILNDGARLGESDASQSVRVAF